MSDFSWTSGNPQALKPTQDEVRPIAKRAAEKVDSMIRNNIDNSDFGPDSDESGDTYSTNKAWFNITEPSGREDRFREVIDSAGETDVYVELEGGYDQFQSIYDRRSSSRVTLNLTGSMLQAMRPEYGVDKARRGFDAGVTIDNRDDRYTERTTRERARLVNEQYQFLYLSEGQQKHVFRQIFQEYADEVTLKSLT